MMKPMRSPTPRQLEVLLMAARGSKQRVTAHALGISEHTVRNLMQDAFVRLDATNIAEAMNALGWTCLPATVEEAVRRNAANQQG